MRVQFLPAGLAGAAMLLLAACSGGNDGNGADASEDAAPAGPMATPQPVPAETRPANAAAIDMKDGTIEFRYGWPAQAVAIPELDAWLRANGETLRDRTQAGAREEQKAAKDVGYEFNGYSYTEDWGVVADLPALLVMQSEGYSYTGGAHGMPIVTTLLWDKAAGKRLPIGALFDLPRLGAALGERFCAALDAERAKRRGAPVDRNDRNEIADFVSCVDMTKQIILPVSRDGKALDRVRIVILPYEAGPYAEGIYQIDLPVDAAVLAAVKPAWRAQFTGG